MIGTRDNEYPSSAPPPPRPAPPEYSWRLRVSQELARRGRAQYLFFRVLHMARR